VILLVFLYRMRARWQAVALMVLLLMVSTLAPARFYERIDALISGQDDTGSGRLDIWWVGLRAFEQSGLLGAGLENFRVLYRGYVPGAGNSSHNMYLTALIDLGVPGLAMMLAAIASSLLAVWRFRSAGHDSIVACIATLMAGMLGDILWTKSFWLAWILLTWAMSSEKRADDTADTFVPRGWRAQNNSVSHMTFRP
jgi:O-antigen ligase